MFRFLSKWFNGSTRSKNVRRDARLQIESLEERAVPTVNPTTGVFLSSDNTTINIYGTAGDDKCTIKTLLNAQGHEVDQITLNGITYGFANANGSSAPLHVQKIYFYGYDGNDTLISADRLQATVLAYGGNGNDILTNAGGHAAFDGGAGSDTLTANQNDTMLGGDGNDTFYCQDFGGGNILHGGAGNDTFYCANSGGNTMYGEAGDDTMYGGISSDYMDGGVGNDYLDGGAGGTADTLIGGTGKDSFKAEWTSDSLGRFKNLDAPKDLHSTEGDYIVNPVFVMQNPSLQHA